MQQYLQMVEDIIENKDGQVRKVLSWRKRIKYPEANIYLIQLRDSELLRVDSLSNRLFQTSLFIGQIIDVNDTDVLSFTSGQTINFTRGL